MKKATTILIFSLVALAPLPAQDLDPLERHLFPPELVMQHQGTLRLSTEQQEFIIAQVQQGRRHLVLQVAHLQQILPAFHAVGLLR